MSIENIQNIIREREKQFGSISDPVSSDNQTRELLETVLESIKSLSDNQKKIYDKLKEIEQKVTGSEDAKREQ